MITRFLGKMFSGRLFGPVQPKVIPFSVHEVGRDAISQCALRTAQALPRDGFAAFIVGGAVRDLLLGRRPKDFDIATDATPEEVRALFRRSRVIGRRFRLVHVMCGPETVEVSTFRGSNASPDEGDDHVEREERAPLCPGGGERRRSGRRDHRSLAPGHRRRATVHSAGYRRPRPGRDATSSCERTSPGSSGPRSAACKLAL